jgi:hypothetical protein
MRAAIYSDPYQTDTITGLTLVMVYVDFIGSPTLMCGNRVFGNGITVPLGRPYYADDDPKANPNCE